MPAKKSAVFVILKPMVLMRPINGLAAGRYGADGATKNLSIVSTGRPCGVDGITVVLCTVVFCTVVRCTVDIGNGGRYFCVDIGDGVGIARTVVVVMAGTTEDELDRSSSLPKRLNTSNEGGVCVGTLFTVGVLTTVPAEFWAVPGFRAGLCVSIIGLVVGGVDVGGGFDGTEDGNS